MKTLRKVRVHILLLLFFAVLLASPKGRAEPLSDAQRALSLVDYIARDYTSGVSPTGGKIVSKDEYQEMRDLSVLVGDYVGRLKPDSKSPILRYAGVLQSDIGTRVSLVQLQKDASLLREELIRSYSIPTFPPLPPKLHRGKELFEQTCTPCHGMDGRAETETAKQLKPPPAALANPKIIKTISPLQAFNTMTFGLEKTAMPSFAMFSEEDRWAIASYLFLLRSDLPPANGGGPVIPWHRAIAMTDAEVEKELSQKGLKAPEIMQQLSEIRHLVGADVSVAVGPKESPQNSRKAAGAIQMAIEKVRESLEKDRQGDHPAALDSAVSAYLDGFEKAEAILNALKGRELIQEVEGRFGAFRGVLREGKGSPGQVGQELIQSLEKAKGLVEESGSLSPQVAFLGAFSIVAREGVEAILLLAVILSILRAPEYRRHRRSVHASWLLALLAGALTWGVAHELISGQVREQMEGWISLLAAAVLVYVSFWLIARRDAEKWKRYLIGKIKGSGRFSYWTVGSIAFLAVYREAFETVLFIEALQLQAPHHTIAFLSGILAGLGVLGLIAWIIFRLGKFIPLNTFFGLSGGFLYFLAVVFVGQGVHSLQEANLLSQTYIPFVSLGALGLFPSLEGLAAQGVLLMVFLGSILWQQWVKDPQEESKLEKEVTHVSAELLSIHELGEHLLEHLRDLKVKVGQSRASEGVLKEIIGHTEDLDREIHQVILRLTEIYSEIPQRFMEIYRGVEELDGGEEREKLLARTRAFRAHLESLK